MNMGEENHFLVLTKEQMTVDELYALAVELGVAKDAKA